MQLNTRLGRFQPIVALLPGMLVWWFVIGYLTDGLNWSGLQLWGVLLGGGLLVGYLTRRTLGGPWLGGAIARAGRNRRVAVLVLLGWGLTLGFLQFVFPEPVFLATHELSVCIPADAAYDAAGSPFRILRLTREDGVPIGLAGVKQDASWNIDGETLVALEAGICAHYSAFFKGGVSVLLRAAPGLGTAVIEWDGRRQTVALQSPVEDSLRIDLPGHTVAATSLAKRAALWAVRLGKWGTLLLSALVLSGLALTGQWGRGKFAHDPLWALALVVGLIALLGAAQLGRHAAPVADDFCYAATAQSAGVVGGTRLFYETINGRLLGNFAGMLSGRIFPLGPWPAAVFALLALWSALLAALFNRLLGRASRLASWTLAVLTVVVTLVMAPNVLQAIYWRAGREPLLWPLLIALALAGRWVGRGRSAGRWKLLLSLAGLGLGTAAAGAFHEVYAAMQVASLAALLGIALLAASRDPRAAATLGPAAIGLLGGLVGLGVHVFAPGTAVRGAALGAELDVLRVLYGGIYQANYFLFDRGLSLLTLALVGLGWAAAVRLTPAERTTDFWADHGWYILPGVIWLGLMAGFAVGYYALDAVVPERTQFIPVFVTVLAAPVWGILLGRNFAPSPAALADGTAGRLIQLVAVIALSVSSVFHAHVMMGWRPEFKRYQAATQLLGDAAQSARAAGVSSIVAVRLPPNPLGLDNPGLADSENFVNGCVNRLLGVQVDFR